MRSRVWRFGLLLVLFVVVAMVGAPIHAQGQPFVINEVLVGNASTNLDPVYTNYSPWVELRNNTNAIVNLAGYKFDFQPDGSATTFSYVLPNDARLPANGYLLLWADEENSGVHAGFEFDMDGGVVIIRTAAGATVDSVVLGEQQPDISYGRLPANPNSWGYFDRPTPAAANSTPSYATQTIAPPPTFSLVGGRHSGSQSLTLSTTEPGATIRYTTDGSIPTSQSTAYAGPIAINTTTMIRARTYVDGKMNSPTATQTYLINVPDHLPIVSVTTAAANLFDDRIGIYVKGSNGAVGCRQRANWHQSWTRPANIEFYEATGEQRVNQEIGLEIHGNCSRNMPQKSFEIKARKVYGDNTMDYAFFDTKPMTRYKRLILRNAGQDIYAAKLRDAMIQTVIVDRMDIDRQAYRPAIVYLNGEYWGVYDLREKMDEDFIENNYGLDEETDFDLLEQNARPEAGNAVAWTQFMNELGKLNLKTTAGYEQLKTLMDVDAFMNYLIVQYFSSNTDWPRNNTRYWNDYGDDYRWRWLLYDLDLSWNLRKEKQNMIMWSRARGGPTSVVIRRLMESPDFRAEFTQRFIAHMNTTFEPTRVIGIIDQMSQDIAPAMPDHIARWGRPTLSHWEKSLQELRNFATRRPGYMRSHLQSLVGKAGNAWLTVGTDGEGTGQVLVSGAPVENGYRGLHFKDVPMTLTAVAAPGSKFVSWSSGETTPAITIPFGQDTDRIATFAIDALPNLIINEIHYNPADSQGIDDDYEFVEIYNAGDTEVDISGYSFTSGIVATIPDGATIAAGEYIVIAKKPASYTGDYQVFAFADGSLNNSGELLTFANGLGFEIDSVNYSDRGAWPTSPDGSGPSLSLLPPDDPAELDTSYNDDPANWAPSRQTGGTPGAENFPPIPPNLIINEIHYNPADSQGIDDDYEFVEIYNAGDTEVDISGYSFTSGIVATVPDGTTIAVGEYIVFAKKPASYDGDYQVFAFSEGSLSNGGETLTFSNARGEVDSVTYSDTGDWPTSPDGSGPSLSLLPPDDPAELDTSYNDDPANWAPSRQVGGTPGAENFPVLPLSLVINEIHYNPADSQGADADYEFVELVNTGEDMAVLGGVQLSGAITYTFPMTATLEPGGYLVVAANSQTYSTTQVLQWSSGLLPDAGGRVTLTDADDQPLDEVVYGVADPWPTAPNGDGPSLSLGLTSLDNSLAAGWAPSTETGGTPGSANFGPLPIVINEVHYRPNTTLQPGEQSAWEFIELYNAGSVTYDLSDYTTEGVTYTFGAGSSLAPGGYLLLVNSASTEYDAKGCAVHKWTDGDLADTGETLSLMNRFGTVVSTLTYGDGVDDAWPDRPNGEGPSLSLDAPNLVSTKPGNWSPSRQTGGSPCEENFPARVRVKQTE